MTSLKHASWVGSRPSPLSRWCSDQPAACLQALSSVSAAMQPICAGQAERGHGGGRPASWLPDRSRVLKWCANAFHEGGMDPTSLFWAMASVSRLPLRLLYEAGKLVPQSQKA